MLDLIRLISTNDHFFSISGIRWCARALRRWLRRPVLAWTTRPMAGLLLLLLLSLRFRVFFFLFFSDDTKFSLFNGPLHPAAKWNQNWNTSSKWNSIESTLNTSYSQRHYLIQLASNRWHSKWCLVNIKKSPPPKKTDAQPTTDDLLSTALAKNSWTAFVDCHLFRSLRVFGP